MKVLVLILVITASHAHSKIGGQYKLDVGESTCPEIIRIGAQSSLTKITKSYSDRADEVEFYSESLTNKISRKIKEVIKVTSKKITVETFNKSFIRQDELLTHKSYTLAPKVMRHSLVYQESNRENFEFMRCLYIGM